MSIKSSRHGGDVFGLSEEEQDKVFDFSININPLGLSPEGRAALLAHWEKETLRYPDVECRALKKSLSVRYGIPEESMALGNGATELMYKLLELLHPKKVIVPAPSFSEYRLSAEAAGCPVDSFLLKADQGFALPLEEIEKKLLPHSLIYLGHPNNPDGQMLSPSDFEAVLRLAKKKESFLIIDESFIDFVGDDVSYRHVLVNETCGAVVMSLTKFYAVPGLRIGAAYLHPVLAERLQDTLIPWNVNGLAQSYMTAATQDTDYIRNSRVYCQAEREKLSAALDALDFVKVLPGSVNFILCRLIGRYQTAEELQEVLMPYHILIRQCGNYEGLDETYFRVAVRTEEENRILIEALRAVEKD